MTGREKRKQQAKFWGLSEENYIKIIRTHIRYKKDILEIKEDFNKNAKRFRNGEKFRKYIYEKVKTYLEYKNNFNDIYFNTLSNERKDIFDGDERARYALLFDILFSEIDEYIGITGIYNNLYKKVSKMFCEEKEKDNTKIIL